MAERDSIEAYLRNFAGTDPVRLAVGEAILRISRAGRVLTRLVAGSSYSGSHGDVIGDNHSGDQQKALDVLAHEVIRDYLVDSEVAVLGSEEMEDIEILNPNGRIVLATDPLDGSSNIDTNVSVGTIFSILPHDGSANPFLQPGTRQLAAGYLIYGPHTDLVLTVGQGTVIFTLDRDSGEYLLAADHVSIAPETREFAINASNYRHWNAATRQYFHDCVSGQDGPRGHDFNMRWIASLVAEVSRILVRGGIFLYPGDARKGYGDGRIRIIYEANPIAFLIEQAGGRASTGPQRVLEIVPRTLHQRTPLFLGAANEVRQLELYAENPGSVDGASLFAERGLHRDKR
jgi:fructose-1,6-bisphosphatase I